MQRKSSEVGELRRRAKLRRRARAQVRCMVKTQFVGRGDCVSGQTIKELELAPGSSRPESVKGFSHTPAGNGEPLVAFEQIDAGWPMPKTAGKAASWSSWPRGT